MSFSIEGMKLNDRNEVIEPEIHDCEIIGINLSGPKGDQKFNVELKAEDGLKYCLTASGVVYLYCSSFRVQNVVSYIEICSRVDCQNHLKKFEGIDTTVEITENLSGGILEGRWGLVNVVPSVGCEIICVCKSFEIKY